MQILKNFLKNKAQVKLILILKKALSNLPQLQKKKQKEIKAKQTNVEVKNIQIRVGTGEADLKMKAERAIEWLQEGHRVKAELYLRGRAKYMDKKFLHERLGKVLDMITEEYKVVDDYKASPKGIAILIEPVKKK